MNDSDKTELRRLIENEIDLGFTFVESARLSGSEEHRDQALGSAVTACNTAVRLIGRVPTQEVAPLWLERLKKLRATLNIH